MFFVIFASCLSVCVSYFGITFYAAPSMSSVLNIITKDWQGFWYFNRCTYLTLKVVFNVMDKFSF